MEVSTSTVMVAKALTFAVFAADQVIQPAFEAAKVHVADENYSRSERFSQNGHKNSRDRHLRAVPLLRESGLSVGNHRVCLIRSPSLEAADAAVPSQWPLQAPVEQR